MAQTRPREIFGPYDDDVGRRRGDGGSYTASASRDARRARGHKAEADKARETVDNLRERRLGRPFTSRERRREPRKETERKRRKRL